MAGITAFVGIESYPLPINFRGPMHYLELSTEDQIRNIVKYHNDYSEYVVLDVETTGLDPNTDVITDIVMSGQELNSAVMFPGSSLHVLTDLRKPLVLHNFKFDFKMALKQGVDLRSVGLLADTMLIDHLLDENNEHGLDAIVRRRYNDNYKDVFWSEFKEYTAAPRFRQLEYACKDVIYTGMIYRASILECEETSIPQGLLKHVHSLALTLYDTEVSGIKLDLDYLSKMGTDLTQKISSETLAMRALVPNEIETIELDQYLVELDKRKTDKGKANVKRPIFNFDSVAQLGSLLYDQLELPIQLNKQKKRTVDDAALERIENSHPIVGKIREYRGHQKVYTSFIDGSLKKMWNGRIYPSFNVNGTVTGRISSSNPNLQQLPKDGGVRGIYISDPGQVFVSADYKQLEVTLAAHFSRDKNLLRIVNEGASQHDITAQGLGISRAVAKTINFALQYGAGVQKVQKILGCSPKEAEHALNKYWETYSGLRDFVKQCHRTIEEGKPLISPFGRRRHFPSYTSVKEQYGSQGFYSRTEDKFIYKRDLVWAGYQRQAANSIIQGTGADCTSYSLYVADHALRALGIGKALFSVHDEIIMSCKESDVEECRDIVTNTMISAGRLIGLSVPLGVDCSQGMKRWYKA